MCLNQKNAKHFNMHGNIETIINIRRFKLILIDVVSGCNDWSYLYSQAAKHS